MKALEVIAVALQLVGLTATAISLWRAWARQNRRLSDLLAALVGGKPDEPPKEVPVERVSARGSAPYDGPPVIQDQGSVEQRLDRHFELILEAGTLGDDARFTANQAAEASERLAVRLGREIGLLRKELQNYVRAEAADAVPLATLGLLITALGTAMQVVLAIVK